MTRALSCVVVVCALGCSGGNFAVSNATGDASTDTSSTSDSGGSVPDQGVTPDGTPSDDGLTDSNGTDSGAGIGETGVVEGGTPGCTKSSDCGALMYCKKTACSDATGTCTSGGSTTDPQFDPVCGCDGNSYWNVGAAEAYDVAVLGKKGLCDPSTATSCMGDTCSSGGGLCVHEFASNSSCAATAPPGRCMQLPKGVDPTCPGISFTNGTVATCDGHCRTRCTAMLNHESYYGKLCTPM